MKPNRPLHHFLVLAGSSLFAASHCLAGTVYWDGASGTWNSLTTWSTASGAVTPNPLTIPGSADDAIFNITTVNGAITVTLDAAQAAQSLTFNQTGSTTFRANNAADLTARSLSIGSGGITVASTAGNVTFGNNAGTNGVVNLALTANQTWTNNKAPSTPTAEVESLALATGNLNYGANTFTINGTGVTGFSGATITGSGNFIKNGTGTVVFSSGTADNVTAGFTGKINLNGGVARFQNTNSLGSGNIEINGGILEGRFGGTLTRAQGTLANQIQITGGVSGLSGQGSTPTTFDLGAITWGSGTFSPTQFVFQSATTNINGQGILLSAIDLNGLDRTIRSDQTSGVALGGSGTFSGNITNGTGTAGLIKTGLGFHILSGTNTYNGGTTINQGALKFAKTVSMPSSGIVAVNTGTALVVDVGQTGEFSNATSGAGSFGGLLAGTGVGSSTVTYSGAVTVGIDITGTNVSYSGNIANPAGSTSLALLKLNGNNLTLTGASTYTGRTQISGGGGILVSTIGNTGLTSSPLGTNDFMMDFIGSTGELEYTGAGETSNRKIDISGTVGTIRTGTNTGALILSAAVSPSGTGTKTLNLLGTSTLANKISGNISNGAGGTLNITKNLAGTWILSGTNTHSGGTTLSGGTLIAAGSSALGSGAITFNTSTTTLQFQNDANTSFANAFTAGGQNINNTLVVDRVTSGASVDLTFTQQYNRANGAVFNFQKGSNITSGTPTITFSGGFTNTDSANATIGGSGGTGPNTFNPTGVNLVINGIAASARTKAYIFQGDSAGNRLTGTFADGTGTSIRKSGTGTWTFAGTSQYSGTTEITGGTLKFEKQTALYNNTASNWTAAKISVKSGGTLAFNVGGTGEFTTGNVTTILANLGGANGTSTTGFAAGSTIGFDTTNASGGTFSVGDVIANSTGSGGGALGLTKTGSGRLILTNTNTYTGPTTVSAGVLAVNGSLANTSTTVGNGATLQGSGSIGGSVTIQNGGTLASGNSIQSLATGALTLNAGSTFAFEADNGALASVAGDLTAVTGNLTIDLTTAAILTITELGGGSWTAGEKLTLISYSGSWNGGLFNYLGNALADDSTFSFSGVNWTFNYNDTAAGTNFTSDLTSPNYVTMTVVPEPRAALLGGLGLLMLLRRRR